MNEKETELILYFIHRMPMYINPINRDTIVAFMTGLDVGRLPKKRLTHLLKEYIENEYNLFGSAKGWPYQIELFGQKKDLNWVIAFKTLMIELMESSEEIKWSNELEKNHIKLMNKGAL